MSSGLTAHLSFERAMTAAAAVYLGFVTATCPCKGDLGDSSSVPYLVCHKAQTLIAWGIVTSTVVRRLLS